MGDLPGAAWQKSSYSGSQGDNCVEVAWRKSSYSGTQGDNCVEVGPTSGAVSVRDTKNREAGLLTISPRAWSRFIEHIAGDAA